MVLTSCNEVIDVSVRKSDITYFVVDGTLTNMGTDPQDIKLSRSIDFFSEEDIPVVSGAEVTVSDGSSTTLFTELADEPGTYRAPAGFACRKGRTYDLAIKATIDGLERTYSASSSMPGIGFTLDSIDVVYTPVVEDIADSCWTVLSWGHDNIGDGYFMAIPSVNGYTFPFENHLMVSDYYFANKKVDSFPTCVLIQTKDNLDNYGPCAKYLETGDKIVLDIYSLTKDYYDFINAVSLNVSGQSIPLFSPQPCNCPTNISGDNALGYFTCAAVSRASYTVDDPFHQKHDK